MDCFGTYFTHAQTCNVTRVQSATEKNQKKTRALEFNDGPQ